MFNLWFHNPVLPPGGVKFSAKMINGPFATAMAKIAYCFAVAELGIDSFDGADIRDLLLGKRDDVYNFVGSAPEGEGFSDAYLHEMYVRREGTWVTVLVHLFASCGMSVPYEVVVGKAL